MNAYEKLKDINAGQIVSEKEYIQLLDEFPKEWLTEIGYEMNLSKHRKKADYINEVLTILARLLHEIQYRSELLHEEPRLQSFVHHTVADIYDRDSSLSEYQAILIFCERTKKDLNTILVHMAEYKGLDKLYSKLRTDAYNLSINNQTKPMSKNFDIEKRETYEKPYLKVFLKPDADYAGIVTYLNVLHSVKRVNITDQKSGKQDLTIYPERVYDISEVEQEVKLALTNYFEGSPLDPIFSPETISSISDKAYFQIIDYIIHLGKNLEAFKVLNTKFDEERYRDYFIPSLNFISKKHSAKGEVFNWKGKTDILVFDDAGNNIFIAECKLWNGEAYLLQAVDQLLGNYVTWRDEKTAIIIFNRDNKKFSEVIEKASKAVENHKLCLKALGKRTDSSYSYLFRHPGDEKRSIKLELVLFNFS